MNFPKIIFSLFLIVAVNNIAAQDLSIYAAVNKNKILIGEPLELTISMHFFPDATVSFVPIDSIEHFELLENPVFDTSQENDGIYIKAIYKLTSFDSGHWVIPAFALSPGAKTDTIPVDVVFSDFDPNRDYHDIKDIIEVKPKKKTPWWWFAAGGALLLLLALIYFLRKKKAIITKKENPVISLNAYEEAMMELDELQRSKPDPKTFHSKLAGTFRLYVYRKKGILSLQKTTDDLVLQLKGLDISKEQFDKLAQALRLGDFVKFAKYIPTNEDDMNCFNSILESIKLIEQSGS
ncbi:MAG: LPXTG cell wall anchor domain-containing protein [Chitinophagaceae bacterium]|nr:LPXTG cell wall anchor domain-containing protein [Chitinophagaceae bacterium]